MNILQVINSVDPSGGGTIESIRQMGAALESAGHHVSIVSLDPPGAPFLESCELPVYCLGSTNRTYGFSGRFVSWLRANRSYYDAVIVNGIWQFHSFGTWCALHNTNTPYVVFPHGMLDPWFKKKYPLKHLKKWLYWPWADYRVLRDAHAVVFTCEEERLLARSSFWLYRCKEVVASLGIAMPTGDPKLEVRQFFGHHPELIGKRLALFMGRVHPKKGCDLLIDAFARVLAIDPDWHLVIAGPDQVGWQKRLSQRAEGLGVAERITWTGMISGSMKWGALRAAEIFVLPSHQENFGIAVVEALAAGVPTLISRKVNIWREIELDGAGSASEDSLDGTCEMLESYVMSSEGRRRNMRETARACFEQRFEITKAAVKLEDVLTTVTGLKSSPAFGESHLSNAMHASHPSRSSSANL
jgi:glycosyltransferase involved in cell wall biosynthesis